jgi:hypothetical protein
MNDIYTIPLYDLKDNMIDDNHNVHNSTIKKLIKSKLNISKLNNLNYSIKSNLIKSDLIDTIIKLDITYQGIKEIDIINYVLNELILNSDNLNEFKYALNDIMFYDEDGNINLHCIEGRVARYLQCLDINFMPFWYIKDQLTNIIIKIIKTFDTNTTDVIINNLTNKKLYINLYSFIYTCILYQSNELKHYLELITKNELINIIKCFLGN